MSERKKILIAETEELNLEFLELMLSKLGFDVEKASDGHSALEIITHNTIDLALVNTILPKISGWEILKTMRKNEELSGIPLILLSDIDNVKEKVEGCELGAEDYITKPFNFSVLLSKIRSALRKRELFTQIKLREERILLADRIDVEVQKQLSDFINTIDSVNRDIELLKTEKNEAKSIECFLKNFQEKFSDTRKNIETLQKTLNDISEKGKTIKSREIGLNQLKISETIQ
ncbi:MAG: response regulator [Spirochaetaceae bacterium]|nr:response regulator [Spirochaetaceae bacterium]